MITIDPIVPHGPPRDPEAFRRTVAQFLDRAAEETARVMRREAPAVFGTLGKSVHVESPSEFERVIAPGVNYARAVAEGTGPAAGKARYFPNWRNLTELVKTRAIRKEGFKWAKPGTRNRISQYQELERRAFALARHIYWHGTRPNPFHKRTAEKVRSRCIQLLAQGVHEGLRASLGAQA